MPEEIDRHDLDTCDECGEIMDMTKTRYEEDGYDYLQWICRNDDCGAIDDRHEYH